MTNFEFMEKSKRKVADCWDKLKAHPDYKGKTPSWNEPRMTFDLRGRTAGQASSNGDIRLNLGFVAKDGEDMLDQTVPHEVVHSFLYAVRDPSHVRDYDAYARSRLYGGRRPRRDPHGYTFMSLLAYLGCDRKRTHNYDTSNCRGQRQWGYKCPRCGKEFQLSTTKHNKIRRGQKRWHTSCGPEYPLVRT